MVGKKIKRKTTVKLHYQGMTCDGVLYLTPMKVMDMDFFNASRFGLFPHLCLNAGLCALEMLSCGFRLEICLVALRRTGSNIWEVNASSFFTCHMATSPLLENKQVDYHSIHRCEVWTQREHLSSQSTFIQDEVLFLPCIKVTYLYTHFLRSQSLCLIAEKWVDSGRESCKVNLQAAQLAFPGDSPTHSLLHFSPSWGHTIPNSINGGCSRTEVLKIDLFIC